MMRRLALLAVLLAGGCGGGGEMERIAVDSDLLGRTLEQGVYGAPVWIDVGRDDPFHDAAKAYAELLRRHGREVTLRISAGGHDREYWKQHVAAYLGFYADALGRC